MMDVDVHDLGINVIVEYFNQKDIQANFSMMEEILEECKKFTEWSVKGSEVVLALPEARVLISVNPDLAPYSARIMYIPNEIQETSDPHAFGYKFWVNPERLASLKSRIIRSQSKKGNYSKMHGEYGDCVEMIEAIKNMLREMREKCIETGNPKKTKKEQVEEHKAGLKSILKTHGIKKYADPATMNTCGEIFLGDPPYKAIPDDRASNQHQQLGDDIFDAVRASDEKKESPL